MSGTKTGPDAPMVALPAPARGDAAAQESRGPRSWPTTPGKATSLWASMYLNPTAQRVVTLGKYGGALGLPAWVFWILTRAMIGNPLGYDEQFFMWGGWSVTKGLAPYRDFIEFKPPMTFLSHALALQLFGFQSERFRYFFFWLALTSVLALTLSLIKRGADIVLSTALALSIIFYFVHPRFHEAFLSDTESIGLAYYFWGVAFLIANTRRRVGAEVLGGGFMAICALSKEPFVPCVVATWAASYVLVYSGFSRRAMVSYLKNTTAGVAVVVGALCIYMIPTGAMSAYIATVRGYFTMFRDARQGYCVLLGMFQPTGFGLLADLPLQIRRIHADFFNTATLGSLAPFFAASVIFTWRRSKLLFASALTALLFALYGITASHCYFPHYYLMAQAGLFFFLTVGLDSVGAKLAVSSKEVRLWVRSLVFLSAFLLIWPSLLAARPAAVLKNRPLSEPAPGLFQFIRDNSTAEDKIFTTGPPSLYVYSDRVAAVRESSIIDELVPAMPGETDLDKLRPLYQELVRNRPKIVFLDPEHGHRKLRHLASAIMPFLTEFKYTRVSDVLYLRND
jgi:hypothetical protein